MPFYSYRSASGALRWTVRWKCICTCYLRIIEIGFPRRIVALVVVQHGNIYGMVRCCHVESPFCFDVK